MGGESRPNHVGDTVDELTQDALSWVVKNKDYIIPTNAKHYVSPRFSSEMIDCSMPMSFDNYSRCSLSCAYCLCIDTPIYGDFPKQRGKKQLRKVQVGEIVRAYDEATGRAVLDEVTAAMERTVQEYYEVDTEDGGTLRITAEHPVYVHGKGWVQAQHLSVGDEVVRVHYLLAAQTGAATAGRVVPQEERMATSARMRKNNPMHNKTVAARVAEKNAARWRRGEFTRTAEHAHKGATKARCRMLSDKNPAKHSNLSKRMLQWHKDGAVSKGEVCIREVLNTYGLNYIQQYKLRSETGTYIADFFFPDIGLILEYDQHARHFSVTGKVHDAFRDAYIKKTYGVSTIRLSMRGRAIKDYEVLAFLKEKGLVV